ncbi:MAG: phenylalanine--tRNA ligase subunit alpha [Candidatus Omnitrophica bacterium]|nr:phenylalanine--tRNA ligase subunit alpha [Candidatus Omnitrophota bacterium]
MHSFDFENIYQEIEKDFQRVCDSEDLENLRIKYLGRKGLLAGITASIPNLAVEEKPRVGQAVNELKKRINSKILEKQKELPKTTRQAKITSQATIASGIDLSLPGIRRELGHLHPITQIMDEVCNIFINMGFVVYDGPEIESEYNNFTALNIPLEHPSRDVFDTFYLEGQSVKVSKCQGAKEGKLLLRSHTSPAQIRAMKTRKPPLAVIVPGRVYRPDATDASHSFMFYQIEGFIVDTDIKFSDLKGTLEFFLKSVFGRGIKMRFRPHFFPFTEPSAEVDISCILCRRNQPPPAGNQKKICPVCHGKGWLEILGCGMIHPSVFKHVGIDPKRYTGFAFGMGVDRIAMLKFGINDIRLFYENDLRFLRQF